MLSEQGLCGATEGPEAAPVLYSVDGDPDCQSSDGKPVGCRQYLLMMPTVSICERAQWLLRHTLGIIYWGPL